MMHMVRFALTAQNLHKVHTAFSWCFALDPLPAAPHFSFPSIIMLP